MTYSITHQFFTRAGGVSEGIYASRNCGPGSEDDAACVQENRLRCAAEFSVEAARLCTLYQIHSADVVTVNAPWDATTTPKADAMVTATPNILLGILTADCAPVLFADEKAGVVGAAHAGWKGALAGVCENTIAAMEKLGAKCADIKVMIGPCIRQESYEVGRDFRERFLSVTPVCHSQHQGPDPGAAKLTGRIMESFFLPGRDDVHFQFNLPAYVVARLENVGIIHIQDCGEDTLTQPKKYFSYRRKCLRGEPDYGRQLSCICITPHSSFAFANATA